MRFACALLFVGGLAGQTVSLTVQAPERTLPEHVAEKLSPADSILFEKLSRVGIEARVSQV